MKNILIEDRKIDVVIRPPKEFSFRECLVYLDRSELECLHMVKDGELYKIIKIEDQKLLLKVSSDSNEIRISFLNGIPSKLIRDKVVRYVWDWFDLDTDLNKFYKEMKSDAIIGPLIERYYGLRVIKIKDLFEALCWAIIGQQINLKFAYTLKKRLVEKYGEGLTHNGEEYWLFPQTHVIAGLDISALRELQFTNRKADYIISLAKLMKNGDFSHDKLKKLGSYEAIHEKLLAIRGVGRWTADYVIMKCFGINNAFPIADVGIHNALKDILGLDEKPRIKEIEMLALNWKGWESYASFYLWRSLYD